MKISVIVPTYNPGKYIEECLESLNSQTISKESFEVLLVLNGEKEGQKEHLASLLENYKFNYRLLTTHEKGVSKARNIGLDNALGDYICFIDDDDIVSSNYLKYLLAKANQNRIVASNVKTFRKNLTELGDDYITYAFNKWSRMTSFDSLINLWHGRKFMSSSCCKIMSKKTIGNVRFKETLTVGEDSVFMATISNHIEGIILASAGATYYRRLRIGSASRVKRSFRAKLNIVTSLLIEYAALLKAGYNTKFILSRIVATFLKIFTL